MSLVELIEDYLRQQPGWREHPEHRGTYMQWEDLRATSEVDALTTTTGIAAMRQIVYEGLHVRSRHARHAAAVREFEAKQEHYRTIAQRRPAMKTHTVKLDAGEF